jgi:hypothetical protein
MQVPRTLRRGLKKNDEKTQVTKQGFQQVMFHENVIIPLRMIAKLTIDLFPGGAGVTTTSSSF